MYRVPPNVDLYVVIYRVPPKIVHYVVIYRVPPKIVLYVVIHRVPPKIVHYVVIYRVPPKIVLYVVIYRVPPKLLYFPRLELRRRMYGNCARNAFLRSYSDQFLQAHKKGATLKIIILPKICFNPCIFTYNKFPSLILLRAK